MQQINLSQLAALLGGRLEGPGERVIKGIKGIEDAGPEDLAFLANPKYAKLLPACRAGVVLVRPGQEVPEDLAVIRVDDPYLAYAKVLTEATRQPLKPLGVHPQAVVEASARLGRDVSVHALAYVGEGAVLGDRVVLHPHVYVGPGCQVGDDSVLHPGVVLYHGCLVGQRCIIHGGTIIGADGYGFAPDGQAYFKIPQVGIVQIDDDVEVGALCTIDRAATGRTWIQRGVKMDDHVHVAHNCVIGEDTLLVCQVGISGSTKLGKHVILAGQVGVAGHISIGDNVIIGPQSGVNSSIADGQVVTGRPPLPHRQFLRTRGALAKLPEYLERVRALEAQIKKLQGPQA
ncbi:MAG: UDP-3-O-(3-hydroxymyristoyl)glucosamine N-acyltransferase [Desulfarculus sp.]|nr:UDP-3-O-(3-hydroxymyristoyl)glucosamine N-acyltransferase [Desulfarculus sp.]